MKKYTYAFTADVSVTVEADDEDAALDAAMKLCPADQVLSEGGGGEVYLSIYETEPELTDTCE